MSAIWLNFRNVQSFASFLKRLYFTVLQCLIESWFDCQISEILSFWNVCYKAQVCRCSIAFLRHETLIFHCSKMFSEKLIWQSNIRNFDILKCLLFGSTFEMLNRLLALLKRLYFTVLKCFDKSWFDYQISEILTFWNVLL